MRFLASELWVILLDSPFLSLCQVMRVDFWLRVLNLKNEHLFSRDYHETWTFDGTKPLKQITVIHQLPGVQYKCSHKLPT